jgi:queuine tRNA-ribosyltransferase
MLAAGFFIARGVPTGPKHETTIALTPAAVQRPGAPPRDLLGPDWLEKWDRSAAKFPVELADDDRPAFEALIRGHAQFQRGR